MSGSPLLEVKEADATGRIADIYAELRRALGVPMVNLIFRHMATVPDCLEWVWDSIGPLYNAGAVLSGAQHILGAQTPLPMTFDMSASAWDADTPAVRATCAAYMRSNPSNAIGLHALHLILTENAAARALRPARLAPTPRRPLAPMAVLPPLGDPARLDPGTKSILMSLTQQLHGDDGRVIPSFYRHFTTWPLFLAQLRGQVQALIDAGLLNRHALLMQERIQALAGDLYRTCPQSHLPDPPEHVRTTLIELIELFPPNICKMTVIASAIDDALRTA